VDEHASPVPGKDTDLLINRNRFNALVAPALYLSAAIALSWPLVWSVFTHLPRGHEASGTVQLFNLWTMQWNADRIAHGWAGYWDAPIFYGVPNTFALSEPQPLTGLVFAPLAWLTGNPVLAYNIVVLLALVLNGIAMRRVVIRLGASGSAASLCGLLGVALPYVWWELGVLQLIMIFPALFAISFLVEYLRDPGWKAALAGGAWIGASFLLCGYYALFLIVLIPFFAAPLLSRNIPSQRFIVHMVGALALAAALALPVLVPQYQATEHFKRSTKTVTKYSAAMVDWRRLDDRSVGAKISPWLAKKGGTRNRLYPGTVLLILAFVGFYFGRRDPNRKFFIGLAWMSLAAFILSLGLRLDLAGFKPYELVREYVPGFSNVRSPFRFATFVHVGLATLAAYAVVLLWRRNKIAAILVTSIAIIETAALPRILTPYPAAAVQQPWVSWLKNMSAAPLVMIPLPERGASKNYEQTTIAMLQSLEHGKPMVEGYSGFFPKRMSRLRNKLADFPDDKSIKYLQLLGVRYVVIEKQWLDFYKEQDLARYSDLDPVFAGVNKTVYQLRPLE